MSEIVRQIAGLRVENSNAPATHAWLRDQLRYGNLQPQSVRDFIHAQPEILNLANLVVDSVTPDLVMCRIPTALYDHETRGAFTADVEFTFNLQTGTCVRQGPPLLT